MNFNFCHRIIRIINHRIIRIINPFGTEFCHIVKVRTVQMKTKYAQLKRMLQGLFQPTKPAQFGASLYTATSAHH